MRKRSIYYLIVFSLLALQGVVCSAQDKSDPKGAFVRSLIMPGWGHYYADQDQWTRGQIHLGMEAALIASYFGFSVRVDNLKNQYETLASLKAGVDISGRSRSFQIALGDFDTLQEYNDFQLRSRNWNRLFEEQPENEWNWQNKKDRNNYNNLRSGVDQLRNQLPAILGLMVVNRVVSALSAYNRTKTQSNIAELTVIPISTSSDDLGIVARFDLHF